MAWKRRCIGCMILMKTMFANVSSSTIIVLLLEFSFSCVHNDWQEGNVWHLYGWYTCICKSSLSYRSWKNIMLDEFGLMIWYILIYVSFLLLTYVKYLNQLLFTVQWNFAQTFYANKNSFLIRVDLWYFASKEQLICYHKFHHKECM